MSERCTCRPGRDYDGSEFGPCAYCEEMAWLEDNGMAENANLLSVEEIARILALGWWLGQHEEACEDAEYSAEVASERWRDWLKRAQMVRANLHLVADA